MAVQILIDYSKDKSELIDLIPHAEEESGEKEGKEEKKDAKDDSDKFYSDHNFTSDQILNSLSSATHHLQKNYNHNIKIPVPPPEFLLSFILGYVR
jgi:hypothetical protein